MLVDPVAEWRVAGADEVSALEVSHREACRPRAVPDLEHGVEGGRVVRLANGRAVVGQRDHACEAGRDPLRVVPRQHLAVHVEEELTLAVLRPRRDRPRDARGRVDGVPVLVVLVGLRVLSVPVQLGLGVVGGRGRPGGRQHLLRRALLERLHREAPAARVVEAEGEERELRQVEAVRLGRPLGLLEHRLKAGVPLLGVGKRDEALGQLARADLVLDPERGEPWGRRRERGRLDRRARHEGRGPRPELVDAGHRSFLRDSHSRGPRPGIPSPIRASIKGRAPVNHSAGDAWLADRAFRCIALPWDRLARAGRIGWV